HDFDAEEWEPNQRGSFLSYADPHGNELTVTSWTANSAFVAEVQRSVTAGGSTFTESLRYDYVELEDAEGPVTAVTLRRKIDSGSWSTVRKVEYDYYGMEDPHGQVGDLKTAVITDGSNNVLETKYYRYYEGDEETGFMHGLKYVFEGPSFDRL